MGEARAFAAALAESTPVCVTSSSTTFLLTSLEQPEPMVVREEGGGKEKE